MTTAIGAVMTEHIATGRLEDQRLTGEPLRFPENPAELDALVSIPSGELVEVLAEHIANLAGGKAAPVEAIGVAVPGIVRHGVVEDSPNLPQIKGMRLAEELGKALTGRGIAAPVHVGNDADAIAAGVAATRGRLDRLTRVWTIGNGIGYGRWPYVEGVWEGGHVTVTLDPRERYCGCGGVGHLEGIMGYRAMRLRFLDMEPEEVFANAKKGDARCREFVDLWHRALAAATASFIHLAGPGRFYFTGHNVGFLELPLLRSHLETMVKMSPLQSFSLEILPQDDEIALLGAGVSAVRALAW
ncbi:MAG: ROK family protein [Acidobacteriota bacterium]|nr:ROK family protein [Acidobacteriota bacterium]